MLEERRNFHFQCELFKCIDIVREDATHCARNTANFGGGVIVAVEHGRNIRLGWHNFGWQNKRTFFALVVRNKKNLYFTF